MRDRVRVGAGRLEAEPLQQRMVKVSPLEQREVRLAPGESLGERDEQHRRDHAHDRRRRGADHAAEQLRRGAPAATPVAVTATLDTAAMMSIQRYDWSRRRLGARPAPRSRRRRS